jgi:hypothetical protein
MPRPRTLAALAAIAAIALVARPISATTVVALDDDALVHLSARIVHGDVVSKTCQVAAEGGRIYTEYRFRPREMLKGTADADGLVTFREWGGAVGAIHYWIPGLGEFRQGEEVLAFLGTPDAQTGVGFTTGLSQGKYHVTRDAQGGARVRRDLGELRLVNAAGADSGAPGRSEGDLERFKAEIRARVGR